MKINQTVTRVTKEALKGTQGLGMFDPGGFPRPSLARSRQLFVESGQAASEHGQPAQEQAHNLREQVTQDRAS